MNHCPSRLIPMCRRFRDVHTGAESGWLVDLLSDTVHIEPWRIWNDEKANEHKTPFAGIEVVPYRELLPEWALPLDEIEQSLVVSEPEFVREFIDTLVNVVEANWNPSAKKIIFHTSGFDSRMLSWAIAQLQAKHGGDWLGDISYVCWGTECPATASIFEYHKQRYGLCSDLIDLSGANGSSDIDAQLLDIGCVWDAFGCVVSKPINLWFTIWREMRGCVHNLDNIELWSMAYANESFKRGHAIGWPESFTEWYEKMYWGQIAEWSSSVPVRIKYPMLSEELTRLLLGSKLDWNIPTIRKHIVAGMDPELADLPRADENEAAYEKQHRRLSDVEADEAQRQYDASWYGREVYPGAKVDRDVWRASPFWKHWSLSGICERLLARGSTIQIGHACV